MISVFLEGFEQHMHDHGPLLPTLKAVARENYYPRLPEISVPTVVMVGTADHITPLSTARRLAAGVPGARLVTVPDAGHWPDPDWLVHGL